MTEPLELDVQKVIDSLEARKAAVRENSSPRESLYVEVRGYVETIDVRAEKIFEQGTHIPIGRPLAQTGIRYHNTLTIRDANYPVNRIVYTGAQVLVTQGTLIAARVFAGKEIDEFGNPPMFPELHDEHTTRLYMPRALTLEERAEDIKVLDPNGKVYATIRNE